MEKNEFVELVDSEILKERKIKIGYIKVFCANDGCTNFWGISPMNYSEFGGLIPLRKTICDECAGREKAEQQIK